jgi:hypothetical protein
MSWLYTALVGGSAAPADTSASLPPMDPPPSYETSESLPTLAAKRMSRPLPPPLDLPALNQIRGKRVILASASPRRRQLLSQVCRVFLVPVLRAYCFFSPLIRHLLETSPQGEKKMKNEKKRKKGEPKTRSLSLFLAKYRYELDIPFLGPTLDI